MPVSKMNAEGYRDPVAYAALTKMEREEHVAIRAASPYRPLVYICSPYAGDIEKNTENARGYSRFAVEQGMLPVAPHLLFPQFVDERTERHLALKMGMVLLSKCEQVWVFGDVVSEGMVAEINRAGKMRKKIHYFTCGCKEAGGSPACLKNWMGD